MKKTAIIIGATGLTGSYLLDLLLYSNDYQKVKIFTRRTTGRTHPKLEEYICDVINLSEKANDFIADEVFCCIGTTKAQTPDQQSYHAIDYGIPVRAAQLSEQNNITTFSVISAIGADTNSIFFYNKTKGQMERDVLKCRVKNILIYRPSFIYGKRKERRIAEKIGVFLLKTIQFLLVGKLKKFQPISGKDLAETLFLGVKNRGKKIIPRDLF